jgi:cytochrome c peroxidase
LDANYPVRWVSFRCKSTVGESYATFTDEKFHRLSVGARAIENKLPALTRKLVALRKAGKSLDQTIINDPDIAELGRFAVTLAPADIGAFRTPSLRNVAVTAPYMHNGSVRSLEEALDLEMYYRGVERGYPLILTIAERNDLIAFLRSLTGPQPHF